MKYAEILQKLKLESEKHMWTPITHMPAIPWHVHLKDSHINSNKCEDKKTDTLHSKALMTNKELK